MRPNPLMPTRIVTAARLLVAISLCSAPTLSDQRRRSAGVPAPSGPARTGPEKGESLELRVVRVGCAGHPGVRVGGVGAGRVVVRDGDAGFAACLARVEV